MTRRRFPSRRPHATALAAVLALVAFSTALLLSATSTLAKVSHEYDGRDGTLPWVEPPVGGDDDEPTAQRPRGEAYDAAVSEGGDAAGGGMPSDPGGSWFRAVRRTVERVHAAVRVSLRFLR